MVVGDLLFVFNYVFVINVFLCVLIIGLLFGVVGMMVVVKCMVFFL